MNTDTDIFCLFDTDSDIVCLFVCLFDTDSDKYGMRLKCQNDLEMVEMKLSRIGYLDGMTEWCRNEGDFKIKGFALVKKSPFISPHSIIPASFLNDKTASNEV